MGRTVRYAAALLLGLFSPCRSAEDLTPVDIAAPAPQAAAPKALPPFQATLDAPSPQQPRLDRAAEASVVKSIGTPATPPALARSPAAPAIDAARRSDQSWENLGQAVGEGRRTFDQAEAGKPGLEPPVLAAPGRSIGPRPNAILKPSRNRPNSNVVRRAVVLGAGPAGLMAALTLIKSGAQVTLVEQRDSYTLPINFGVRQDLINEIAHVAPDALKPLLAKMSPVNSMERIDTTTGKIEDKPVAALAVPKDGKRHDVDPLAMLESPYAGLIRAADLEQVLFDQLAKIEARDAKRGVSPRVRILQDSQAQLSETTSGRYGVSVQRVEERVGADGRKQRDPVGEPEDLGHPDLIIDAEGTHSSARQALHLRSSPTSPKARYVAASIEIPMGGRIRVRYGEVSDASTREPQGVRQILMGNAVTGKSWLLAEIPSFVDLKTPEETKAYFVAQVAPLLGLPAEQVARSKFEWGPNAFELQQNLSERASAGDNVVLIGDAVGNAHFSVGGGMMTATVPHQQALERLLDRLRGSSGATRRLELARYDAEARQASLQWTRLGLRYFGRSPSEAEAESRYEAVVAQLEKNERPLLRTLIEAGLLDEVMNFELGEGIGALGSIDTRPRALASPVLRTARDLSAVDDQIAELAGRDLWESLKTASRLRMDRADRLGNELDLPPEGIHPLFGLAAKPLLEAAAGRQVTASAKEGGDRALAAEIAKCPAESVCAVTEFLRQCHIGAALAPRSWKALNKRMPMLPETIGGLIKQIPILAQKGSRSERAAADEELSVGLSKLSGSEFLLVQNKLAAQGLLADRMTFFGWVSTPAFARAFPKTDAAMRKRDARAELLRSRASADRIYQQLDAKERALMDEAAKTILGSRRRNDLSSFLASQKDGGGAATRLLRWALLQDQKLEQLKIEQAFGEKDGTADPQKRTIQQTFFDHLRARRHGDLEGDLKSNYSPNVIFTSNQGNFFGLDGVRQSAARLAALIPGRDWTMNRVSFFPTDSPREGYVTEVWSAQGSEKQLTAVDNFYIKDGKILLQSAYYLDPVRAP